MLRTLSLTGLLTVGVGLARKPNILRWFTSENVQPAADKNPRLKVWVNTRSGFYYCPHAGVYGRLDPGRYMVQREALQEGFRPAPQLPCR